MNPNRWLLKVLAIIIFLSIGTLLIFSTPAAAVNYNITRITNNSYRDYFYSGYLGGCKNLNNAGQLVWVEDTDKRTIFFRDSNDNIQSIASYDYPPPPFDSYYIQTAINDKGQIAWVVPGDNIFQLYFKEPNGTPQLIDQTNDVIEFSLNNLGQMAWMTWENNGTIKLYDKGSIVTIGSGVHPSINNRGQIIWTNGNLYSCIYCYNNGVVSALNDTGYNISSPCLNDAGQIAWSDPYDVYLYDPKNDSTPKCIFSVQNNEIVYGDQVSVRLNNNGQLLWVTYGYDNSNLGLCRIYLYNLTSDTTEIIAQGIPCRPTGEINDLGQIIWNFGDDLYLSIPGNRNNPQKIVTMNDLNFYINDIGQIVFQGEINSVSATLDIYLATPQTINVPIPTATPPLNTFPPPQNLFTDSGNFIKNHGSSFSPDSQQNLNDNLSWLDRFLLKAPVNNFLLHTLSSPGWKSAFGVGEIVSGAIGSVLSLSSIEADAAKSPLLAGLNLSIWSGTNVIYDKLQSDYLTRGIIDSAASLGSVAATGFNPVSFLLNANGIIYGDFVAGGFAGLANDPPDPNFTEVFQSQVASTAPFNLPGVSPELNKLLGLEFGSLYNTYYFMNAITTSVNRYGSALAAGDALSAGLQFEAFVKYLTLYDSSAIQTADYVKQVKQALISQGLPDTSYNQQQILDLQNQIKLNGLGTEVTDYFKNLGLTDSQISDLTQAAINYVPPGSASGSLYSNLSNGVDLLHAASSWRPPNPALSLLLLD